MVKVFKRDIQSRILKWESLKFSNLREEFGFFCLDNSRNSLPTDSTGFFCLDNSRDSLPTDSTGFFSQTMLFVKKTVWQAIITATEFNQNQNIR